MGIRRQLILAICIIFFVALAFLGRSVLPRLEQQMTEDADRLLLTEAMRASEQIDHWLTSRGYILRMLATELELSAADPSDPLLQKRLDDTAVRFGDQFAYLYCGFDNGSHLSTRGRVVPEGFDPRTRPWYERTMQRKKLTFTEPYADVITGRMSLTIAYPVNTPVKGVVGTDVYLADMAKLVHGAFIHPEAEVIVVSRGGQILFASEAGVAAIGDKAAALLNGALNQLIAAADTAGHASGDIMVGGSNRRFFTTLVPSAGWHVLVYVPESAFAAKKTLLVRYVGMAAGFALLGVMLAVYWLVGRIIRPLEVISAQAARFQLEGPDVDFAAADGAVEVRRLAAGLDTMKHSLLDAISEKDTLLEETRAQNEEIQALYSQVKAMNDSLSEAYKEKEDAYVETIKALADAIEAKDCYTRGHSDRVRQYAMLFADALHWAKPERTELQYTAILHDIGKIGLPLEVLNKPGSLSNEEYDMVKQHPAVGWRILNNISHLAAVNQAVRQHHEKMDGTGYPDGAHESEICHMARILSIVDAFDAMTSTRPYRAAMSKEAACAELTRCAGKQFDADLVKLFCEQLAPQIELP